MSFLMGLADVVPKKFQKWPKMGISENFGASRWSLAKDFPLATPASRHSLEGPQDFCQDRLGPAAVQTPPLGGAYCKPLSNGLMTMHFKSIRGRCFPFAFPFCLLSFTFIDG